MSEIQGVTGEEMCQTIIEAGILQKKDGTKLTTEEVWNYSPTGELFMVFEWYKIAREVLKVRKLMEEFNSGGINFHALHEIAVAEVGESLISNLREYLHESN